MSFGVVQTAIITLRNNKNLLSVRDRFKNTLVSKAKRPKLLFPKATPKVIEEIRSRLRKENQIRNIKIYMILFTFCLGLIVLLIYFETLIY